MKFFPIALLLLFDGLQGLTLPEKRPNGGFNTTLLANFSGQYERRNPCNHEKLETSSYRASHEFHHHTKGTWTDLGEKCSAIIGSFLKALSNLMSSNDDGVLTFQVNTSVFQKPAAPHDGRCSPTIIIEASNCPFQENEKPEALIAEREKQDMSKGCREKNVEVVPRLFKTTASPRQECENPLVRSTNKRITSTTLNTEEGSDTIDELTGFSTEQPNFSNQDSNLQSYPTVAYQPFPVTQQPALYKPKNPPSLTVTSPTNPTETIKETIEYDDEESRNEPVQPADYLEKVELGPEYLPENRPAVDEQTMTEIRKPQTPNKEQQSPDYPELLTKAPYSETVPGTEIYPPRRETFKFQKPSNNQESDQQGREYAPEIFHSFQTIASVTQSPESLIKSNMETTAQYETETTDQLPIDSVTDGSSFRGSGQPGREYAPEVLNPFQTTTPVSRTSKSFITSNEETIVTEKMDQPEEVMTEMPNSVTAVGSEFSNTPESFITSNDEAAETETTEPSIDQETDGRSFLRSDQPDRDYTSEALNPFQTTTSVMGPPESFITSNKKTTVQYETETTDQPAKVTLESPYLETVTLAPESYPDSSPKRETFKFQNSATNQTLEHLGREYAPEGLFQTTTPVMQPLITSNEETILTEATDEPSVDQVTDGRNFEESDQPDRDYTSKALNPFQTTTSIMGPPESFITSNKKTTAQYQTETTDQLPIDQVTEGQNFRKSGQPDRQITTGIFNSFQTTPLVMQPLITSNEETIVTEKMNQPEEVMTAMPNSVTAAGSEFSNTPESFITSNDEAAETETTESPADERNFPQSGQPGRENVPENWNAFQRTTPVMQPLITSNEETTLTGMTDEIVEVTKRRNFQESGQPDRDYTSEALNPFQTTTSIMQPNQPFITSNDETPLTQTTDQLPMDQPTDGRNFQQIIPSQPEINPDGNNQPRNYSTANFYPDSSPKMEDAIPRGFDNEQTVNQAVEPAVKKVKLVEEEITFDEPTRSPGSSNYVSGAPSDGLSPVDYVSDSPDVTGSPEQSITDYYDEQSADLRKPSESDVSQREFGEDVTPPTTFRQLTTDMQDTLASENSYPPTTPLPEFDYPTDVTVEPTSADVTVYPLKDNPISFSERPKFTSVKGVNSFSVDEQQTQLENPNIVNQLGTSPSEDYRGNAETTEQFVPSTIRPPNDNGKGNVPTSTDGSTPVTYTVTTKVDEYQPPSEGLTSTDTSYSRPDSMQTTPTRALVTSSPTSIEETYPATYDRLGLTPRSGYDMQKPTPDDFKTFIKKPQLPNKQNSTVSQVFEPWSSLPMGYPQRLPNEGPYPQFPENYYPPLGYQRQYENGPYPQPDSPPNYPTRQYNRFPPNFQPRPFQQGGVQRDRFAYPGHPPVYGRYSPDQRFPYPRVNSDPRYPPFPPEVFAGPRYGYEPPYGPYDFNESGPRFYPNPRMIPNYPGGYFNPYEQRPFLNGSDQQVEMLANHEDTRGGRSFDGVIAQSPETGRQNDSNGLRTPTLQRLQTTPHLLNPPPIPVDFNPQQVRSSPDSQPQSNSNFGNPQSEASGPPYFHALTPSTIPGRK